MIVSMSVLAMLVVNVEAKKRNVNSEGENQARIERQAPPPPRRGRKQGNRPSLPRGLPPLPGTPGFGGNLPDLTKLPDLNFDCSSPESMSEDGRKFCTAFNKCLKRTAKRHERKIGNKNRNKRIRRQDESEALSNKDRRICHTRAHLQVVTQTLINLPPTPASPTNWISRRTIVLLEQLDTRLEKYVSFESHMNSRLLSIYLSIYLFIFLL